MLQKFIGQDSDKGRIRPHARADNRSTDRYIHNRTEYLRDALRKRGDVVELTRKKTY